MRTDYCSGYFIVNGHETIFNTKDVKRNKVHDQLIN